VTSEADTATRCEIAVLDATGRARRQGRALAAWLQPVLAEVAPSASSLTVRLTDDTEMRALNRRYRGQDRTTDVLSFAGEATPEGSHLGDLVISLPVARRQAHEAGHPLERELRELALHGVLHCLGHDHETDEGEMAALELSLRERWSGGRG
jgi:probable rRNA maturation factor